jgi:hypothetical protein
MDGHTFIAYDGASDTFWSETGAMGPAVYHRSRANVLGDLVFRYLLPTELHNAALPVISANGNVKRDFICVQHHLNKDATMGRCSWKEAFCVVYGIDSLAEQHNPLLRSLSP